MRGLPRIAENFKIEIFEARPAIAPNPNLPIPLTDTKVLFHAWLPSSTRLERAPGDGCGGIPPTGNVMDPGDVASYTFLVSMFLRAFVSRNTIRVILLCLSALEKRHT